MWSISRMMRKAGGSIYKKRSSPSFRNHSSQQTIRSYAATTWAVAAVAVVGGTILVEQVLSKNNHDEVVHCKEYSNESNEETSKSNAVVNTNRIIYSSLPYGNINVTACEVGNIAQMDLEAMNRSMATRMASRLRRHHTIQKMQVMAAKETLESKYDVKWNEPLGEGSFGQVFLAVNKATGEELAVKKISKQFTDNISFQREMDALLHLRSHHGHPHICGLRENFDEGRYYYLVLDLVRGGEMFDHLCANGAYSEADAARLIREVASALAFLHGIGIVHGDMKPENLMLSSENASDAVIKVVDFGCAQTVVEDDDGKFIELHKGDGGIANTPAYCPPEVLEKRHKKGLSSIFSSTSSKTTTIDPSFDMWALGVILYIMLTGVHPFDLYGNASDAEIEQKVMSGQRPPIRNSPLTAHLSNDALSVIERLIQWNSKKRITAQELLQHPWVRGETALTKKMADSDKRLSAYRAFKTKLEAKAFADMASLTISSNDDDVQNVTDEELKEQRKRLKTERLRGQRATATESTDSVGKRTSLIEMAFHKLDPQHKGYVTTADLQKLSQASGGPCDSSSAGGSSESDHLSLSGFSDLLAENMKDRYFPKGHIVYHEGDVGNNMYFINSGSIEVYTRDGFSKTLRYPGDFFGEGALLHPNKIRSATIRCVTPVHAIEISREYFEKYLASDLNVKLNLREKDKSRKRQRAKSLLRLQHSMDVRMYKKGDILFKEGEEGKELFILEEGKIGVSVQNHFVFNLKPGEMCGEHSLILGRPRNTTAVCVSENGCKVHVLRARDFFTLLDAHPSMKESIRDICLRREFQKALCIMTMKAFPKKEKDLRHAFDLVDHDKSGYLELTDISDMIKKLDPTYTESDVREILASLDLGESGKVSWEEFKRVFGYVDTNTKHKQQG